MARLKDMCIDLRMRVSSQDDYINEFIHIEKELKYNNNIIMTNFMEPISIYDKDVKKNIKLLVSLFRKSRQCKRLFSVRYLW